MRKWGIIGALLFVAACVVGYIFKFEGSDLVALALAGFAIASTIVGFVKKQKEKGVPTWKTVVVLALTVVGGVLVCIGGLSQNIFAEISGAVLALMTIIFGLIFNKQKQA